MKIDGIVKSLSKLENPRRIDRGNIRHKLEDIIIIGLCTLICNGEDFPDMEEFGKGREEWLRKFLELPNGIPDSDTFRRVFERMNPEALSECLYDWLDCNREEGSVIAIDGKTIRGSKRESHKAYHVVSAFVAENQLVLGELVTEEKSNEITAVPELLEVEDYYIPDLTAEPLPSRDLGKYGRMRLCYLQDHKSELYTALLMEGRLFDHLLEIEDTANSWLDRMMPEVAKAAGVTEKLKARDQMAWVGLMNNCKASVEEIIFADLIYS